MATAPTPVPAKPTLTTDAETEAAWLVGEIDNAISRAHFNGWVFALGFVIANVIGVLLHV